LIDRARIKKQFAKTLKKEGLTSERLGGKGGKGGGKDGGGSGIPTDERGRKVRDGGWGRRAGVKQDTEGANNRDDEEQAASEVKVIPAPTADITAKSTTATVSSSDSQPLPSLRTLKREAYAIHQAPSSSRSHPVVGHTSSSAVGIHPSRTRTAAAKASAASGRIGGLSAKGDSLGGGKVAGVGGTGKKSKGQPNMGARMDVLLEKIKRSKAV
jgi:hypothetical protein